MLQVSTTYYVLLSVSMVAITHIMRVGDAFAVSLSFSSSSRSSVLTRRRRRRRRRFGTAAIQQQCIIVVRGKFLCLYDAALPSALPLFHPLLAITTIRVASSPHF